MITVFSRLRHRRWNQLVDRAVDGDLAPAERARLDEHLAACDACSGRLRDHQALQAALRATIPAVAPPRSFALTPAMVEGPESAATPRPWMGPALALSRGTSVVAAIALVGVFVADVGGGTDGDDSAPNIAPASADLAATGDEDDVGATPFAEDALDPDVDRSAEEPGEGTDGAVESAPADDGAANITTAEASTSGDGNGGLDALRAAQIGLAITLGVALVAALTLQRTQRS